MAMQALILSIVACETSTADILELIMGCQLADISGTANTKYRDYAAEDILEELHGMGYDVQKAEHLEDDGASMLEITMFVPDEMKGVVEQFIKRYDESDITATWGVSIGDDVIVPDPTEHDMWNFSHQGNVIGFHASYAEVEDGDNNVWCVEPKRLTAPE